MLLQVNFENVNEGLVTALIYNSSGAEIRTFRFSGTYKLNDLITGMYYYRILDSMGNVSSGKIIVTK